MPKIFISYRRDDSGGQAGRLFDHLTKHFGGDSVFMDVDTIDLGHDFEPALKDAVSKCDIMLAVIGRDWLDCVELKTGTRRLDNPRDWVRIEIAEALGRGIPVVPVLVRGAALPTAEALPENVRALASRQATSISDSQWQVGIADLVHRLKAIPVRRERERMETWFARLGLQKLIAFTMAAVALLAVSAWLLWPTQVEMPDLVGKPLEQARLSVQSVGLRLQESGIREEETLSWSPGTVVAQDPSPGRHISAQEVVNLKIAKAPPSVDLSRHVKIRNIVNEGISAGAATVTAIEVALAQVGRNVRLSERYLYSKAKRHDERENSEGTWLTAIVYVAERFGVPPYDMWPFVPGQRALPDGASWTQLDSAAAKYTSRFYRIARVEDIYAQLRQGRPVIAIVKVMPQWQEGAAPETGRIEAESADTSKALGDSVIVFVGFDPKDGGVLRFANCWSKGWGDNGFGTMSVATARLLVYPDSMWAVDATSAP
ncbi:MAG TPA: TIR domain-containing protein [Archangium sp.]|nr:TIR domain-containing protein [Archangium sp.]